MTDLLDIAPATAVEVVRITGDRRLMVHGLHGNAIASIAARFPDLVILLGSNVETIVPKLFDRFGAAIGPVIAAGCGHLGDDKAEQIAGTLLIEDQVKLLKAILGLTFPNGLGPFMQELTAMLNGPSENAKTVRVRSKKSPSPLPPLSETDSRPTMQ